MNCLEINFGLFLFGVLVFFLYEIVFIVFLDFYFLDVKSGYFKV